MNLFRKSSAAGWLFVAAATMCLLLSGCATSKAPTDEGSYMLGDKKHAEDPLSLTGAMEVSVGYATGDFRDARRAVGPSR